MRSGFRWGDDLRLLSVRKTRTACHRRQNKKCDKSWTDGSFARRFVLLVNKSDLRQKARVKLDSGLHIFNAQINVIEQSGFHHFDFRFSRRIINFKPDQVSSTAQTLMSTNPSGRATARITSSVTSVATPDDFFGHETQIAASSAILCRSDCKCVCKSRRAVTNR